MSDKESILRIKILSAEVLAQQAERKLSSSRENLIKLLAKRRQIKGKVQHA